MGLRGGAYDGKNPTTEQAERWRWRSPPQVNPEARDAATLPAEIKDGEATTDPTPPTQSEPGERTSDERRN